MFTVAETQGFTTAAKAEGMTNAERTAAIEYVAATPDAGDLIQGSGGCRKVRVAREGAGKSGGYRLVTFTVTQWTTVYLIAVLKKGSRANFSDKEVAAMATLTAKIRKNPPRRP